MANLRSYYVEMRGKVNGNTGTTIGTHVYAHSEYEAMGLAEARNPEYRALFARVN